MPDIETILLLMACWWDTYTGVLHFSRLLAIWQGAFAKYSIADSLWTAARDG